MTLISTLTSKQKEGMDDRAGSGDTELLTTRGKMPVYGIAFVSTLFRYCSPRNSGNMCSANNDLTSENGT